MRFVACIAALVAGVAYFTSGESASKIEHLPPVPLKPVAVPQTLAPTPAAPQVHPAPVTVAPKSPQYNRKPRGGLAYVEPPTRASYINHLANDHGFDREWLKTQDADQLFALHSDEHYGLADESLAVRSSKPAVTKVALPTAINYVSEKEAIASGKVRFYVVTDSKTCQPCRLAKQFMSTPAFIKASADFACVLIDRAVVPQEHFAKWTRYYRVTTLPATVFVSPDGKRHVAYNGLPHTAPATGGAYYLQILNIGREEVLGKYVEPVSPNVLKNIIHRPLIPTPAATKPPQTPIVVEGRQKSAVVTRRTAVQTAPCTPFGCGTRDTGMRTPAFHWLGPRAWQPRRYR
jgi:hypothetical protein